MLHILHILLIYFSFAYFVFGIVTFLLGLEDDL